MEVKDILGSNFYNSLPERDQKIYENYFVDFAKSPFRGLNQDEKEIFARAVYIAVTMVPSFRDALALLRPFVDVTCDTAYVDKNARNGLSYWFFWYTKDDWERATILLHESMHLLYNHFSRSEIAGIKGKIMLYSSDLEINSVINKIPRADISHGISPSDFGFPDMKIMEVYASLLEDKKNEDVPVMTSKTGKGGSGAMSLSTLSMSTSSTSSSILDLPVNAQGLNVLDELFIRQMNGGAYDPEQPPGSGSGEEEGDGEGSEGDSSSGEGSPSSSSGGSSQQGKSKKGKSKSSPTGDQEPSSGSEDTELTDEEAQNAEDRMKEAQRKKNLDNEKDPSLDGNIQDRHKCDEATEDRSEAADEAGIEKVSSAEQTIAKKNTMEHVLEESRNRTAGTGSLSEFLKITIGLMSPPKADWRKIFKSVLASYYSDMIAGRTYSSLSRINRRYSQGELLFPGTVDFVPTGMLGFDVSGSMGNRDYQAGLAEIEGILKTVLRGRDTLKMFPIDVSVQDIQYVKDIKDIKFTGGGGTDMSVAFDYVNKIPKKNRPSIFILVTDGGTDWESIGDRIEEGRGYKSIILVTDTQCYNNVPDRVRRLAKVLDIS